LCAAAVEEPVLNEVEGIPIPAITCDELQCVPATPELLRIQAAPDTIKPPDTSMEYSMSHNLDDTIALLSRTPATLNSLLRDQPEIWTLRNEGDGTWTTFEVVGHLVHGERADWMPRLNCVLQHGEARAFEPFDRWAQDRESKGKSLPQLLDEFAQLRSENLDALRSLNLQPQDLERRGQHPSLGTVTMSQLLATWAAHDMTHLHQVARIMAYQYREAVGPWSRYLGVLKCSGHSS
jgi:hypothetical protein